MTSYPRSIYQPLIDDGERIRDDLLAQITNVHMAIENVKQARYAAKQAQDNLAAAEAEYVAEAVVQAEAGFGLLHGIAKTSKAYQYAIDNLLAKARENGLGYQAHAVQVAQSELLAAEIIYEQTMARFGALKHAADLTAAIINGTRA